MEEYREKIYKAYDLQWTKLHSSDIKEYEFYAKIAKKRFAKILPENKEAKILDVACGAGHFLYFLKKEGYLNIKGIDVSEKQIELAKGIGLKEVEKADLFVYLPKHKGEFEAIVALDIIEHLKKEEIINFLNLIRESLKPEGLAIIHTINASSLMATNSIYLDFTHEVAFTATSLAALLQACGFEEVKVFGDGPVMHDFKSFIRVILWELIKVILKIYRQIESGTGRHLWRRTDIFEPAIFAVAKKGKI